MQEDPKPPIAKGVAKKEEVAPSQLCDEGHRDEARDVCLRQIVDVIVLGDCEALPLALRVSVDLTEELEDHAPLPHGETRIRVRHVHDDRIAIGGHVQESALVTPRCDVGDDVDLLSCLGASSLQREIEVRCEHEGARDVWPQQLQDLDEPSMDRAGIEIAIEEVVELVVQRPDTLHQRNVFRDLGKVTVLRWSVEGLGEECRDVVQSRGGSPVARRPVDAFAQNRHEPTGEKRLHHIGVVILDRPRRAAGRERRLLAENRSVELLKRGAGVDAELVGERPSRLVVDVESVCLAAVAVQRKHELPAEPLAERRLLDERLELGNECGAFAELEICVDSHFEHFEAQLFEPAGSRSGQTSRMRDLQAASPATATTPRGAILLAAQLRRLSPRPLVARTCRGRSCRRRSARHNQADASRGRPARAACGAARRGSGGMSSRFSADALPTARRRACPWQRPLRRARAAIRGVRAASDHQARWGGLSRT